MTAFDSFTDPVEIVLASASPRRRELLRALGISFRVAAADIDERARAGEAPAAPVFIDGKKAMTLRGATVAQDFKQIVIDYIERRYGQGQKAAE